MGDIHTFHVLFSGVGDLFFCGSTSVPRSEDFTESESDFDDNCNHDMMSIVLGKLPQIVPYVKQSRGGLITYCSSMGDCLSLFREVEVMITYGSKFNIGFI